MGVKVDFYQTGDNPKIMDKILTLIASQVDCDIKEPTSVDSPYLLTSGDLANVNYAYIEHFGRYYWVYPETGLGIKTRYRLESDPLMSFKVAIRSSPAVIARNPWHFDLYLPDPKLPIEARTASAVLEFTPRPFSGDDYCYILTTIGG